NARVDVFDEAFQLLTTPMFATPPGLPADFAPFNVMVFGNTVYVAYAQQNEEKDDSVEGPGLGFVAAFDACGTLKWTAKGNELDAPWGMAMAGDMPQFPGALLVGNFGDGRITALNLDDGNILGQVMLAPGTPAEIDGLWGIATGTGVDNAMPGGLYFAAGPDDEMHGMFGVITAPMQ
ncbi:MAG TPA: TIGR03118 family protein, partial [Kofleriaceae bacterium]|nr:TIGR03118 family protein [Kofleriaceae bacterium]